MDVHAQSISTSEAVLAWTHSDSCSVPPWACCKPFELSLSVSGRGVNMVPVRSFVRGGNELRKADQLLDSIDLSEQTLNQLFGTLLLTSLCVFIGGNLLLLNLSVFWTSSSIALPCVALILIFYSTTRVTGGLAWGLALTYGLMWLLVYSRLFWAVPMFYTLAVLAFLYTVRFLRIDKQEWWLILVLAVIGTAVILGCGTAYTSFDMKLRLLAGGVHQDTLFHASIAAMIKNYGIASTGLHGLVEIPYHTLSHVLMAAISLLSGVAVFEVYGVANWVLFAPILIFSIVAVCLMTGRGQVSSLPLSWGLTALFLAATPFLLRPWGSWDSFFVSESYLVSLGLFLSGLALLFKRRLSVLDLALVLLLTILMSNAKASVGMIFAGLCFTRLAFVRGDGRARDLMAFIMSALAVGWVVLDVARAASGSMSLVPLDFVRNYSLLGKSIEAAGRSILTKEDLSGTTILSAYVAVVSFFVLHFVVSWAAIYSTWRHNNIAALIRAPLAAYSFAAVIAGSLVVTFVAIPGGSAYYFSNVAFFVSLPGVVILCVGWIGRRGIDLRQLLFFGVISICLLGVKGFYSASALHRSQHAPSGNKLIDKLTTARVSSPKELILRPAVGDLESNPVTRCTARPFVFPAVSERPWIDVIADSSESCQYRYYGYAQYGLSDTQNKVKISPRLLPGMSISQASR